MESKDHITLTDGIKQALVEHALKELPNECCGVLLGRNTKIERIVPMRSVPPAPDSYFMDPEQQVELFAKMQKSGETLLGIYHSHPDGPSHPSDTDLQLAFHPEALYFIISLKNRDNPEVRAFVADAGKFNEATIRY